jgi:hypothetical protein
MQPQILEKALHAWSPWGELIREARIQTQFNPSYLKTGNEIEKWEKEIGWEKAIRLDFAALGKLGLPWYFGFYWLACFCSDYDKGNSTDFSAITKPPLNVTIAWCDLVQEKIIKDKEPILLFHKGDSRGKIYPPYPFILETSFLFGIEKGQKHSKSETYGIVEFEKNGKKNLMKGAYEVDKSGKINQSIRKVMSFVAPSGTMVLLLFGQKRVTPPAIRVEFTPFLATEDVVSTAFKQIAAFREGNRRYLSHPLLKYIGPAKVKKMKKLKWQCRKLRN